MRVDNLNFAAYETGMPIELRCNFPFFSFSVLGVEPRVLYPVGKYSQTQLLPQSPSGIILWTILLYNIENLVFKKRLTNKNKIKFSSPYCKGNLNCIPRLFSITCSNFRNKTGPTWFSTSCLKGVIYVKWVILPHFSQDWNAWTWKFLSHKRG